MKERVGQKIKLTNYEALLGVSNEESAVDVSIRDIHSFENHPFKVIDDDKMAELVESIKVNGVLTPVLIRPSKKTRGYEMISGHRRLHAAGLAGLSMIPAIVREMDDDKIEDKDEFARLLVRMCKENSFQSIRFSTDRGYATSLDMRVYLWRDEVEGNDPVMTVEYKPEEWNHDYDIINNPDEFSLYVDGELIENQ